MTAVLAAATRAARRAVGGLQRHPRLRRTLLHPFATRPGYMIAGVVAMLWWLLLGRCSLHRRGAVFVADRMPRWSFGRGGTMVGWMLLTDRMPGAAVIGHEAVHRRQWRTFGLLFPLLYLAAGADPLRNRFEIEAGLEAGGYVATAAPSTAEPTTTAADAGAASRSAPPVARRSPTARSRRPDDR